MLFWLASRAGGTYLSYEDFAVFKFNDFARAVNTSLFAPWLLLKILYAHLLELSILAGERKQRDAVKTLFYQLCYVCGRTLRYQIYIYKVRGFYSLYTKMYNNNTLFYTSRASVSWRYSWDISRRGRITVTGQPDSHFYHTSDQFYT